MVDDHNERLPWLPELLEMIRSEVAKQTSMRKSSRPDAMREIEELRKSVNGYSQSLANPELDPSVRAGIENSWSIANARIRELEGVLTEGEQQDQQLELLADPQRVLANLDRLAEILENHNCTLANVELSLHIDSIHCHQDGRVVMRTCMLGALAGTQELVRRETNNDPQGVRAVDGTGKPRRRAVRRVDHHDDEGDDWRSRAETAADPDRFASLPEQWFWEDEFQIPPRLSWAEEHAAEVADQRLAGLTHEQLGRHFEKSVPTIREALKYAKKLPAYANRLVKKMPRRRWHEDHALEVAEMKETEDLSTSELARHFRKSEPMIRKALEHAAKVDNDQSKDC